METLKFFFTTTFYPPYCFGGDAFAVKYLAEALAKKGHEVKILHSIDAFSLKSKRNVSGNEKELVKTIGLKTRIPLIEPSLAFFFGNSPLAIKAFKKELESKPDIVHHHNISLLGNGLFERKENYKNIYTAHDSWLLQRNPLQIWRNSRSFRNNLSNLDFIISPSNWLKEKIANSFNSQIFFLPNFVSLPKNYAINKTIVPFEDFFLFVGALEQWKGIFELLETISKTKEKLVVVGKGSLEHKILDFIKRKNLEKQVVLFDWLDHDFLFNLYENAKAIVFPTSPKIEFPDNCPLVVLEAMAVGTPTIVSNAGGLPEIAEKISPNLVFQENNLKQKILNYNKKDYPLTKSVFEENFSEKVFLKKYFELLK